MSETRATYHVARDGADGADDDTGRGVPLTDAQLAWLDRVGPAGPDPYDRSLGRAPASAPSGRTR